MTLYVSVSERLLYEIQTFFNKKVSIKKLSIQAQKTSQTSKKCNLKKKKSSFLPLIAPLFCFLKIKLNDIILELCFVLHRLTIIIN